MKYLKKAGIYKASNVTFDPNLVEARSYSWWIFVKQFKVKGRLVTVFNDFPYSNTTRRHQWKVKRLMQELGFSIDAGLQAPNGLQNLQSAWDYCNSRIKKLEDEIAKKGTRKAKNEERRISIGTILTQKRFIEKLMQAEKQEFVKAMRGAA